MFRFACPERKARWELIADTSEAIQAAIAKGHRYITALSLDRDPDLAGEENEPVRYKGPMYFDLDSDDEEETLYDLRRLLISLYEDFGVNLGDLRIWASGGKGFHVEVPSEVFNKSSQPQQNLAYTYKNMAKAFSLITLDYSIYSQGKGRQWRIANLQRPNERFKVSLTAVEALSLSFAEIKQLTYAPRFLSMRPVKELTFSAKLAALYKSSHYKPPKTKAMIKDEVLAGLADHPECIKKILSFTDIDESKRFNHIAMTIAGYAVGRGIEVDAFKAMVAELAEKGKSTKYKTKRARLDHLVSIYRYVQSNGESTTDYHFACAYARGVVTDLSCNLCELNAIKDDDDLGITEANGCYYRRTGDDAQKISTFVIKPQRSIIIVDGSREEHCLNATLVSILGHSANVIFKQENMVGKAKFQAVLPSPAYAYLGGDVEVSKIFYLLAKMDIPTQKGVKTVGLHYYNDAWHFVSNKGSWSVTGAENELMLTEDVAVGTNLLNTTPATKQELKDMIDPLLNFNSTNVVIPIVGWHVACMFKERIFKLIHKFPILFVFGEAGSGKTTTAMSLRRLFAISEELPLKSAGDLTAFTLVRQASLSTLPMYLDEYKSTSFSQQQMKNLSKVIRAAYQNEEAERGKADQTVTRYAYKAPMVFIGEQTVTEAAAKHRIVEVQMISRNSAPHLDDFNLLETEPLEKLGRILLEEAMTITDEELQAFLDEEFKNAPPAFKDRPRTNFSVIMTGIRLLRKVIAKRGLSTETLDKKVEEFREWKSRVQDIERIEFSKSDIDRIFEILAVMTRLPEPHRLIVNEHFKVMGDELFIQMRLVYQMYMQYSKVADTDAERMNWNSFSRLLHEEPYFVSSNGKAQMLDGMTSCYVLNIPRMQEKNLDVEALIGADNEPEARKPLEVVKA